MPINTDGFLKGYVNMSITRNMPFNFGIDNYVKINSRSMKWKDNTYQG